MLRRLEILILDNLNETANDDAANCNRNFKVDWIDNDNCRNFNWGPSFSF